MKNIEEKNADEKNRTSTRLLPQASESLNLRPNYVKNLIFIGKNKELRNKTFQNLALF